MSGEEPWYVAAFRSGYRAVYPHRDVASARKEARWLVEHGVRGRVLDLCCGFGRHTLALFELGCDVHGVDLSMDLLREAAAGDDTRRIAHRLVRGDARAVPFRSATFDSVVVLFSSFGYFGDDGDAAMLGEVARLLVPGGTAVLDLMNPERVREALVPSSRDERAGRVVDERRRLEDGGRRVVKEVRVEEGGSSRAWTERVRLYAPEEVDAMLRERGLELVARAGDFDATPYGPRSSRQIVLARRRR